MKKKWSEGKLHSSSLPAFHRDITHPPRQRGGNALCAQRHETRCWNFVKICLLKFQRVVCMRRWQSERLSRAGSWRKCASKGDSQAGFKTKETSLSLKSCWKCMKNGADFPSISFHYFSSGERRRGKLKNRHNAPFLQCLPSISTRFRVETEENCKLALKWCRSGSRMEKF